MPGLSAIIRVAFTCFLATVSISSNVGQCAGDEYQHLRDAIEHIRTAPQWQHLDPSVVDEANAISRSGPELNAAVTVLGTQGKPVANALVAVVESSHDLVNTIERTIGLSPLDNRLLPIAMRATDEQGKAEFTRVHRSNPSRATEWEPSIVARAQLIVITREYAWFAMPLEGTNESKHYDVTLEEPNTLRGSVVGPEEKPIEGASVTFSTWGNDSSDSAYRTGVSVWRVPFTPRATSGSDGTFTLAGVPKTGFASVNVTAPGLVPDMKDGRTMTDLATGTVKKKLIPQEQSKRRFRIVDKESGKPLRGGSVTWRMTSDAFDEQGGIETNHYELAYQSEDTKQRSLYMEIAAPPGYLSAMVYGKLHEPDQIREIPLERGIELRGRVQDMENGAGIAGTKIIVVDADRESVGASLGAAARESLSSETLAVVPLVSTHTDHDGNFSLLVPRRKLRVQLVSFPYGFEVSHQSTDQEPSQGPRVEVPVQEKQIDLSNSIGGATAEESVVFGFARLKPISGTVVDADDKPIPNAKVYSTVSNSSNPWRSFAKTGPDGAFVVMPIPGYAGDTSLLVESGEKKTVQQVALNSVGSFSDKPITVVLDGNSKPRTVTGGVTVDGLPEAGVEVTLYAANMSTASSGLIVQSRESVLGTGVTNKEGIYEINVIDTSVATAYARVSAPQDLSRSLNSFRYHTIGEGKTQLPDIEFRTKYGNLTVSGEIVTPEGDPVVGATVYAYPEERNVQLIRRENSPKQDPNLDTTAVTDEEGRFVCKNLGPEKVQLQIRPGKAEDTWANALFQSVRTKGGPMTSSLFSIQSWLVHRSLLPIKLSRHLINRSPMSNLRNRRIQNH